MGVIKRGNAAHTALAPEMRLKQISGLSGPEVQQGGSWGMNGLEARILLLLATRRAGEANAVALLRFELVWRPRSVAATGILRAFHRCLSSAKVLPERRLIIAFWLPLSKDSTSAPLRICC